jgi:hypothetical protein
MNPEDLWSLMDHFSPASAGLLFTSMQVIQRPVALRNQSAGDRTYDLLQCTKVMKIGCQ